MQSAAAPFAGREAPWHQLETPGHVIVAGDMDADEAADSMRFWTGRHVLGDLSVCYRSAWESARPGERLMTFTPENPNSVNPDWPFRGIDHVLIRCGDSGGGKKTAPTRTRRPPGRAQDRGTRRGRGRRGPRRGNRPR